MHPLGPFGPGARLAVGVSGGPHSLALALLADRWARASGGDVLALIADHGVRPESGSEAQGVARCLAARAIPAQVLRLNLSAGPGLQERAREARLRALARVAAVAGRPWLLLGHHRADQAETLLFRALRGSGPDGLSAMAAVRDAGAVLVLRPLLGVPPARLEAVLAAAGLAPIRDPSNADARFARVRLRASLADPDGDGPAIAALARAAAAFGLRRERLATAVAQRLAQAADIRPEGFAWIDPAALGRDGVALAALARLLHLVGNAAYAPRAASVAVLLARGAGTLSGAWLQPAAGGRWLLSRDPGMVGPQVPASHGAVWDGRFRLAGPGRAGWWCGALGADAAGLRGCGTLPSAVLRALPAIRAPNGMLAAVPALLYPSEQACAAFATAFMPGAVSANDRPEFSGGPFTGGQPDLICSANRRRISPPGTETDNRT